MTITHKTITKPGENSNLLLYSSKYLVIPPMPEGILIRSSLAILNKLVGRDKPPFVSSRNRTNFLAFY